MDWSERDLIELLAKDQGSQPAELLMGIGDDCAVYLPQPGTVQLITTDMLVQGIHFDLGWHPAEKLGRKCAAVNLSDIAAMGGTPQYAFLSLAVPAELDRDWLVLWGRGLLSQLRQHNCVLAGGDTVKGAVLTINLTVVGSAAGDRVLYRHTARAGQAIYVSGRLGAAAAGLELFRSQRGAELVTRPISAPFIERHLDPQPEVALGQALAASRLVSSMQDISDGIATDLAHICHRSGLRAEIEAELLPHHQALPELAAILQVDPLELMVCGGDDYLLLFTMYPEDQETLSRFLASRGLDRTLYRIGRLVEGTGVFLQTASGQQEITYRGFQHTS